MASNLTEEQKLVKLGLRSPNQTESAVKETEDALKTNIAEEWATFQENFEDAGLTSWSSFETWLVNNGISSSRASNIRSKFEAKYADWATFKDKILNQYESWSDFENDFASNAGLRSTRKTDSGLSAAGIRVYEESGVGRSGQDIPAGGVEIYGAQVHFSQTGTVRQTEEEAAGTQDPIVWSNITVSDTTPYIGFPITISADLTHNTPFAGTVVAELIVDGSVAKSKNVELTGNDNKTIEFEYIFFGTGEHEVGINDTATQTVTVDFPLL